MDGQPSPPEHLPAAAESSDAHSGAADDFGRVARHVQLESVLDAATQLSICVTDTHGVITLFNSGAEDMLGYRASEMVGRLTTEVLHLATEVENRGGELSRKDGQQLTVNLVVTAVRNEAGEITGFLGVAEDITERKRSEEALRKSEERFDLAVAGSNDGIWDWDIATGEVYYEPRFKELLGYRNDEFQNTFAAFEQSLHPDDWQATLDRIRHHLDEHRPYDVEYRLRTNGGDYRWYRARGQAIWDTSGRAVRMAGSLTDITDRKQAEAALEQNAAEIQRANETLRVAEAEARKAVVERDQFLAMLSHELRNPLSAILNGVGVLGHAEADAQSVEKARVAIERQVDHMSRLLDDLLDVARITQGKIGFRKEILDLNALLLRAGQAMQTLMETRGHTFSTVTSDSPVMVEGDPTRLFQVVENLLTNAAKYTPAGGRIILQLQSQGGECALSVEDNGRGIDPDLLEEIFDMFFQSNHALDRSDGGMGVGLTLVRALVQMHQGTVAAYSEGLGLGSKFVVRLPLATQRGKKSPRHAKPDSVTDTRVLLVEDNADSREMLQTILRLNGFQVNSAEDGQQGLAAILEQHPDVAVIDIGLPKLDGYEVARRVRQQFSKSKILIIALNRYGQTKDRGAVFAAGFDEHLVKPVNLERLKRLLSRPRKPR